MARITAPPRTAKAAGPVRPDFAAHRKAMWGSRVLSEAEVAAMREEEQARVLGCT